MLIVIKHGHASGGKTSPTYQSWRAMRQRCNCPNNKDYHSYGGKGIKVDTQWNSFTKFLEDMGERPSKEYSLDRVDSNKNYEPSNCQWILKSENSSKANSERWPESTWVDRLCLHCNKSFKVKRSDLLRGHGKFCSISCGITFRNLAKGRKGGVEC